MVLVVLLILACLSGLSAFWDDGKILCDMVLECKSKQVEVPM